MKYVPNIMKFWICLIHPPQRPSITIFLEIKPKWKTFWDQATFKAYRLYKRDFARDQEGKVGISLNINWFEPLDVSDPSHVQAAETKLQFFGGWFGHPIFVNGDYPVVMREKIQPSSRQSLHWKLGQ